MANWDDNRVNSLLRGLGLAIDSDTVKKIAARVIEGRSLYPLHNRGGGEYVAAKNTVTKVRNLVQSGQLDSLLEYWGLKQTSEEKDAHVHALETYLKTNTDFRDSFHIMAPIDTLEWMTSQREGLVVIPPKDFVWESFPIISDIRAHCPRHALWQHIEEFKEVKAEYSRSILDAAKELRSDFEQGLAFNVDMIFMHGQERLLISAIFGWLVGQRLGEMLPRGVVEMQDSQYNFGGSELGLRLVWGGYTYAEGRRTEIEKARYVVTDILKRWSYSDDIMSVAKQYHSLQALSSTIAAEIQQIDSGVLALGKCPACPALK